MANTQSPLLQELARATDSHDIRDLLSVLFRREVIQDSQKMQDYHRLSNELREGVRLRDKYINYLQMSYNFNKVAKSIEIMRRMQLDDMEKASRLMLMAREIQTKLLPSLDGVDNLLALIGTPDHAAVKHLLTFLSTVTVSAIAVGVTRLPTHAHDLVPITLGFEENDVDDVLYVTLLYGLQHWRKLERKMVLLQGSHKWHEVKLPKSASMTEARSPVLVMRKT
ncbi:hypothetical protein Tco_0098642 [Tanacetum coccineum]